MNNVAAIITALTPIMVGVLASAASLAGVHINNKRQDKRALYDSRSESVSKLFASINRAERNMLKVELCLKANTDLDEAVQYLLNSLKEISAEYDRSAIFFPSSIAQIIESILFTISEVTVSVLSDKKQDNSSKLVAESLERLKLYKKELRDVFQIMMGIKK